MRSCFLSLALLLTACGDDGEEDTGMATDPSTVGDSGASSGTDGGTTRADSSAPKPSKVDAPFACTGAPSAATVLHTMLPKLGPIAADNERVYWVEDAFAFDQGKTHFSPLAGGTAASIPGASQELIIVGNHLFTAGGGAVVRRKKDGTERKGFGSSYPSGIVTNGTEAYWFPDTCIAGNEIEKLSETGTEVQTVYTPENEDACPTALAVDGTSMYWAEEADDKTSILRRPLAGGAPQVLASGRSSISRLVVVGNTLYFYEYKAGGYQQLAATGGSVEPVFPGGLPGFGVLVTDGTSAYAIASACDSIVKLTPGQSPTVIAQGIKGMGLALGGDRLFIKTTDSIASIPKS